MQEAAVDFRVFYLQGCSEQVSLDELLKLYPNKADQVGKVHDAYCEVHPLLPDAKKHAKTITRELWDVWEECLEKMAPKTWNNHDALEATEHIQCFCTLFYDYKKKVQEAKERLEDAEAESKHIEMLQPISEDLLAIFVAAETNKGLITSAADRAVKDLGRLAEPTKEKDPDGATDRVVQIMKRLQAQLEDQDKDKKATFLLEVLRKQYQAIYQEARALHALEEEEQHEKPDLDEESRGYALAELMNDALLKQVDVVYVKALRTVAKEVLSTGMPKALNILLGSNWHLLAEPVRGSRLRALSFLFHPDKVDWITPDLLEEAGFKNSDDIFAVQKVISDAIAYLKRHLETAEKGKENLQSARNKWQQAVEKSKKEKEARDKGTEADEARAARLKEEKKKCALEALTLWRGALRIFSEPAHKDENDRYFQSEACNVRMEMAEACEMLELFLECQVYLLSAMRSTAKAVGECSFSSERDELEKHKKHWLMQRSFLQRLCDRQAMKSQESTGTKVLSLPSETLNMMLVNNLDSQRELQEVMSATSDFDVKTGLVFGTAIDQLCDDCLGQQKAKIDKEMQSMALNAAVAACALAKGTLLTAAASTAVSGGVIGTMALAHAAISAGTIAVVGVSTAGVGLVVAGGLFLTAGFFWAAGTAFGWRSSRRSTQNESSWRKKRQSVVIEVMQAADQKRTSGEMSGGLHFLQELAQDLSQCEQSKRYDDENQTFLARLGKMSLFKEGQQILKFPSKNFLKFGEIIEDVEGTINFLATDIEICAAGVLQYLIRASEVVAGRELKGLSEDVNITRSQALAGAMQLMLTLLEESGGTNCECPGELQNIKFELKPKPEGTLLKKAQKEDAAEKLLETLEGYLSNGKIIIKPSTKEEDVDSFLTQGWVNLYVSSMPAECETITHENLAVNMNVRKIELTPKGGEKKTIKVSLATLKNHLIKQDYDTIEVTAERGCKARISLFFDAYFKSAPTKDMGPKEKAVIKSREILKINIAIVLLIGMMEPTKSTEKTVQEILAEWLLNEVIGTIQEQDSSDPELLERVEALKDFFLVFLGRPLQIKDKTSEGTRAMKKALA